MTTPRPTAFAVLFAGFLAFFASLAIAAKPGITAWPSLCKYDFQGGFVADSVKGVDCNVATVLFPGTSANPIHPFGDCTYIDNATTKIFFLPLKTEKEWKSFKTHLPKGLSLRSC
jgi:hypothetical protein